MRNIILKTSSKLKAEEIFDCIKKFSSLYFSWGKNINLNNHTISLIIENILSFYLSLEGLKDNDKYIESLLADASKIICEPNTEYTNEKNILITCEKTIVLTKSLITSKYIKIENNEKFLKNYFFLVSDKILDLGKNYIIPGKNLYNDNYFSILKKLFECFYAVLMHFSSLYQSIKNLCLVFFTKYWKEFGVLVELCPPLDEPTVKKFQKPNPIVVFNIDDEKCKNINSMKSSVIQLLSILTQNLFEISNDLNYNKKQNNNDNNDLINFLVNLIKLSVKCFEDLLTNKEKYFFVRNYDSENSDDENSINILLYDLCVLQCRLFIRDPFKNIFRKDIKLFLLNILLPLFSTNDTERNSIESDYDMYHDYLIDNTELFKMKIFRASGMFLINKICSFFLDENNFLLSYILEMFNYTINEGNINNKVNYNIYLENKDKFMIDKLDKETKIDLFFLIILLLRYKIKDNILIKNRLRELLIENQSKIHQINSLAIKIKICKMYSVFIPILFKNDENISQKKKFELENTIDSQNNQNMIKENDIKNNVFSEEHFKFIQNAIEYLLKNIEQNISQNSNISEKKDYLQSLSHSAAECISDLIITFKENQYEENEEGSNIVKKEKYLVLEYIYQSLSENFKKIINLIIFIDNPSFFNLIDYIIENIKPKEREDIFICLKNITQKFIKDFKENKDKENTITPFLIEYYKIITDFMKGVNKLNVNDRKEIDLFESILDEVFQCVNINDLENLEESDELIEMIEEYIILLKYVNEKSLKIFKEILPIIKKDKTFNSSLFSFLCTFMKYFSKTQNLPSNLQPQLIEEMIQIIKLSSTFSDEMYNNSVKHSLLLTLNFFNAYIKETPFGILKDLILLSLNSFAAISKEDLFVEDFSEKIIINQIVLANISFGFIFRPSDVYKIIFEKKKEIDIKEQNFQPNNQNAPKSYFLQTYNSYLVIFINLILTDLGAATTDYIILLNKCIILGFCSIFKEKYCLEQLNNDMNLKILMINMFAKLIEKHKKQQIGQLNKIMKKETNCNFIEEPEFEEEEEEEEEDLEDIKLTIQGILCENENIKNADEYKYFCEIVNEMKKSDKNTYDVLNGSFNGQLEDLLLVRNININYKGKEFKVPRKTVKILKKKK